MKCKHKLDDDGLPCTACAYERGALRSAHAGATYGIDPDADEMRARRAISMDFPQGPVGRSDAEAEHIDTEQVGLLRDIKLLLQRLVDKADA